MGETKTTNKPTIQPPNQPTNQPTKMQVNKKVLRFGVLSKYCLLNVRYFLFVKGIGKSNLFLGFLRSLLSLDNLTLGRHFRDVDRRSPLQVLSVLNYSFWEIMTLDGSKLIQFERE